MTSQKWWTGGVSPTIHAEREGAFVDIRDLDAVGDGVTDNTSAIQRALESVAAGGSVYVPPGNFLIKSSGTSPALTLDGNNITFFGDGPQSKIFIDDTGTPGGSTRTAVYDGLRIVGNSSRVLIQGLQFCGRNTSFGGVYAGNGNNGQAVQSAIAHRGPTYSSVDVVIRGCLFRNLYGHAVRTLGSGESRWSVVNCFVQECTNGISLNGTESVVSGVRVVDANGVYCAGHRSIVIGTNILRGAGIVMGGTGGLVEEPRVIGCLLKDLTFAGGVGFVGCTRGVAADCTVSGVSFGLHGVYLTDGSGGPSGASIVRSCSVYVPAGSAGVYIQTAAGTIVRGNLIEAGIDALRVETTDVSASANRLSGVTADLKLTNADRFRFSSDNVLVNNRFSSSGTVVDSVIDFIGTGVPSVALPNGSRFQRTDGAGPNLYIRQNGVWVAK